MARQWTEEQRKAFGEKMKQAKANKQSSEEEVQKKVSESVAPAQDLPEMKEPEIASELSVTDLQRQIREMSENMELMRRAMLNQNNAQQGVNDLQMNKHGELIGEFEKYTLDPSNYPDPTPRLKEEQRLLPLAFNYNYELEYEVGTVSYETKTGKNIREPKFFVTLNRVVMDEQGQPTSKRYIARKLIFHEDPQAALVIARENGLTVDKSDERLFLNEMRYIRVRDWLFSIFWPLPVQPESKIREEVINGTVVQVFTRNSEEAGGIPFEKLTTRVV